MKNVMSAGVVLAGLCCAPSPIGLTQTTPELVPDDDPRLVRLQGFLAERDCPLEGFARDFIVAAEIHDLDWRLLPSISFIESSGGKYFQKNNVLGWDNCREEFPSIPAGIHYVASRLAKSRLYRDKDLDGKLKTYNPVEGYPARVKSVMERISSDPAILN